MNIVEDNLRRLLAESATTLGRQDAAIDELRRQLAAAEQAVTELRTMLERAHV